MSTLFLAFLLAGTVATVLFFAGYARGTLVALRIYGDDAIEVDDSRDVQAYWWQIGLAVLAAILIIALMGVAPAFIYFGPALAIFTAAMNGLAFFMEDKA